MEPAFEIVLWTSLSVRKLSMYWALCRIYTAQY